MSSGLELSFAEIIEEDIPEITKVMTRAFDDDSQKHLGVDRGGPDGYDNGEFFRKWLFGCNESIGYKALSGDKIVAATIIWIFAHGKNVLGTIFVDPAHQDSGVGTRTWQFIESTYPDSRSWTLETPNWATKNHYFYEKKCGFHRVKEKSDSFVFKKEMGN